MAVTKLERAKVSIVLQHPFFARILMDRPMIEDKTIPTAGVDQRGQLYYNPDFLEKLTPNQIVFLLCHEAMHVVWQHPARVGHRQKGRWNIATDAVINDTLRDCGIGEWIEGGVNMPGSKEKTADQVYNELPNMEQNGGGGNGAGGIGDDLLQRGAPVSAEEAERIEAETKVLVAQAAQVAKMAGKLPGSLAKMVADLIETKIPWHEKLERFMVNFTKGDYSWNRPNRRLAHVAYLPSTGTVPEMGPVVLQVDVSGSVSAQEIAHYNGHIKGIVELCRPSQVHVLYTDTRVCRHDVFEQGEEVNIEFYSGGGTDMEAGFAHVDKEGIEPDVFVCLTDGYTGFNEANAPSYPVVWVISSPNVTAPYGENIHFDMERT